jgi:HEAT repeat protein
VVGAILLGMSAGPLLAQPDPCRSWRRTLDARRIGVLEMAAWFRKQVEPEGRADVECLSRFLLDPMLARGWEQVAAARALARFGLHRLEPALRSPIKEIRDATAVAIFGRITNWFVPAPLTTHADREAFEAHGLSPTAPVQDFIDGLKREDANERTFCIAVLRAHRPAGDARYVRQRTQFLLKALGDEDPVIRWGAALGLRADRHAGLEGEVFDGLRRAMEDPDRHVRRAAVEAIARVALANAARTERVVAGLADPDAAVVAATAESLEWIGFTANRFAMDALCAAASTGEGPPYLRAALLRAIVSLQRGEAKAFAIVRAATGDPAPFVRRTAVRTLPHFRAAARSAVPEMLECSRDSLPSIRSAAVFGLGRIGNWTAEVRAAISGALDDRAPLVRIAATSALRDGAPPDSAWVVRCCARGLEDRDARVRAGAARALERVGRAAAPLVPALIARLEDRFVQGPARRVIIGLGADAVPALIEALAKTEGTARFDLIDILGSLGAPALSSLRHLLVSDRSALREAAISALGRMGPVARPAEADLLEVLRNAADRPLHPFAAWALYRINLGGPPTRELCDAAIENRWCAWAAAQAVRHRGATSPEATALLVKRLDRRDALISGLAADALALSGVSALGQRPPLEERTVIERLSSPDRDVRLEAVRRSLASAEEMAIDLDAVIARGYGVEVQDTFTERRWVRLGEIEGSGRPLTREAVRAARRLLLYALAAYPVDMVRTRLEKVVLLRDLRVYGTEYGGTYQGKTVYLAAGGRPDLQMVRAFHHEFSSLLMKSEPFPEDAWREIHGAGHRYGLGGRYAIHFGRTGDGSADLFEKGFYKPYGLADIENDFNVFSETVMTYPGWARAVAERFPRLRRKWGVWVRFLKRIDPNFVPPARFPRPR